MTNDDIIRCVQNAHISLHQARLYLNQVDGYVSCKEAITLVSEELAVELNALKALDKETA